jgi:hypothetical protein
VILESEVGAHLFDGRAYDGVTWIGDIDNDGDCEISALQF